MKNLHLPSLILVACVLAGCVSKSSYQDLERQKTSLEHELQLARAQQETLRAQLNLQQMRAIESLKVDLAACRERVIVTQEAGERLAKEAAQKGYYQGIAEFHRSLQIAGHSESDGWWIFADHYYTVEVSVAGHTLFWQRVETTDEEDQIETALGTLSAVSELLSYRPRL